MLSICTQNEENVKMNYNNKSLNPSKLKENISHGDLLFNLAVHLTEHKIATDIMLYSH